MLLAAAFSFADSGAAVRAAAAIGFLLLTAPVAAHLIGRAAYMTGQVRLWEGTRIDELRGLHDRRPAAPEAGPLLRERPTWPGLAHPIDERRNGANSRLQTRN
jgi:multicomponent Na+:H+ antiporter subunit G